jgi:SAM-dependent methyltransferase
VSGRFEELYRAAAAGGVDVPWDRGTPSAALVAWAGSRRGDGQRAVVVGCGYGRDSEFLASVGFDTTAFDVSPTAVATARERHPDSPVTYEVADLFGLPAHWPAAFDLVLESHNVQSLPRELHAAAAAAVASLVAPGGTLLVLAAAGDGRAAGPPWPLTRAEIDAFAVGGLTAVSVDEVVTDGVARWQAEFRR